MSVSQSEGGTRSGLLWEVARILDELKDHELPQILLMENVPDVCGTKNVKDFRKWVDRLNELGYTSYFEILNAKDYGIPQNRRRCFMVSLLNDSAYEFPMKITLKHKLKDFLEKQVDEKYFLSEKMMNYIVSKDDKYKVSEGNLSINREIACAKTTREGNTRADTSDYICDDLPENTNLKDCKQILDLNYYNHEQSNRVYSKDGIAPTIRTGSDEAKAIKILDSNSLLIKNATEKGYLEAQEGDGVNICGRMEYQRGNVQKNSIPTMTTMGGNDIGVVVKEEDNTILKRQLCNELIKSGMVNEGDIIKHSFTDQIMSGKKKPIEKSNEMIDTVGVAVKQSNLRIRKITPKESLRLMAFNDDDYKALKDANMSDMVIYHMAGDSIVVNVLLNIIGEMTPISEQERIKLTEDYVERIINGNE